MTTTEVHLWTQSLDLPPAGIQRYSEYLAADEHARATRFHFDQHRHHYIVARGRLREILSGYLNAPPDRIEFRYGDQGKPATSGLKFNLSHSGTLALYAFTLEREIGVDIEEVRPEIAHEQIAGRFFSPNEIAMIQSAPEHLQAHSFFDCWTRKEAYIKARGQGLSIPLNSFDASLESIDGYRLRSVDIAPGYASAVAVAGDDYTIILR